MMRGIVFIILLCVATAQRAMGEHPDMVYRMRYLSVNDGLSQFDISDFGQDDYGFMWVATFDGLNRYDGINVRMYRHEPDNPASISHNRIRTLWFDPTHRRLWAGTEGGGINIFNYDTETFSHYYLSGDANSNLLENEISNICVAGAGKVWVSTPNAVMLLDNAVPDAPRIIQTLALPADRIVRRICPAGSDTLYVVLETGVVAAVRQDGRFVLLPVAELQQRNQTSDAMCDMDGCIWVATRHGLFIASSTDGSTRLEQVRFGDGRGPGDDDYFTSMTQDATGEYFVSVRYKGVFSWKRGQAPPQAAPMHFKNPNFALDNNIRVMRVDYSRTLWLGTPNRGGAIVDLAQKGFYTLPLSTSRKEPPLVTQLMFDRIGRLWVGTQDECLWVMDPASGRTLHTERSIMRTYTIAQAPSGRIWVAGDGWIFLASEDGRGIAMRELHTVRRIPGQLSAIDPYLMSVCEDDSGTVWIAGRRGVMNLPQREGDPVELVTFDMQYNVVLTKDPAHNRIWIRTHRSGLIQLDLDPEGRVERRVTYRHRIDDASSLSSNAVWAVKRTSSGRVYVGTDAGLNMIDPVTGGVTRFAGKSMLGNAKVVAIAEDSSGVLWLGTSRGLMRYDPVEGGIREYDYTDGLSGNAMSGAAAVSSDGAVYLGHSEGVDYFHPTALAGNPVPTRVALVGFRLFGKPVETGAEIGGRVLLPVSILDADKIKLRWFQNNITFEFASLSFNNPYRNRFEYRLRGADKEWNSAEGSHRSVTYGNLSAGTYVFELRGSNNDGLFSDRVRRVEVTVLPAPWFTVWACMFYGFIAAGIVLALYRYNRERQRLRRRLFIDDVRHRAEQRVGEERLRFYGNITHELRTPLSLIIAPLEQLSADTSLSDKARASLQVMKRNSDRMMELIGQYLDLGKAESQNLPLKVARLDWVQLLNGIRERFEPTAGKKSIRFRFCPEQELMEGYADREKVTRIVSNLLSNAFKFTPAGGEVALFLNSDEERMVVTVEDTGCGIEQQNLERIFERFWQASPDDAPGTGIGLELARRLAAIHHGVVTVHSSPGVGSSFKVSIPAAGTAYAPDEFAGRMPADAEASSPQAAAAPQDAPNEERSLILIVEDDEEMREYLVSLLGEDHKVIQAANGAEGLKTALSEVPDLIITDVMMPDMDGMEFCRRVKNDFRVSHVPVIMLTAHAAETEGLEAGAVDYITKPFGPVSLRLKVNNLIAYRPRQRIEQSDSLTISERIARYSEERERKFLEKVHHIVNEGMGDHKFGIDSLTAQLHISRAQLHRKLTALTGKSTSIFIRDVRLDKAREMLETGRYTITEVLYTVGYTSPSYFSKTYRERFGASPSELLRGNLQP